MSIGNVSSIAGASGITSNQQPGNSNSGNAFQNAVTLNTNTPIDLGTIDGKPFEMQIMNGWSGAIQIHAHTGSQVTPEDAAAAYAAHSYTRAEYTEGDHVSAVVNYLYLMTQGVMSTDAVNGAMRQTNITPSEVNDALTRLGLNSNEPFTVNGQAYVFNSENNFEEVTGSPESA